MIYASSALIALVLYFVEVSILPHFSFIFVGPLLVLPFISILSLKDRSIFPIILAGVMGILTDALTGGTVPIFLIAYVSIVLISNVFMGRFISYGEIRANIINITIGMVIIYGTDIVIRLTAINSLSWFVPFAVAVGLTYLLLVLYLLVGRTYFAWIEKESEERFR